MEFKDLAGISKPLTKLLSVVASGTGKVFHASLKRKTADAAAYEIKTIAAAVSDCQGQDALVSYKDGKVSIKPTPPNKAMALDTNIVERASSRVEFQETKRQHNIESVVQYAADSMDEEQVSNEELDEDWVSRFFRTAEDISSEHMQYLWGKILAGEVTHPGTYSLRTLETLKNITQKESLLFSKVAKYAFTFNSLSFLLQPDKGQLLSSVGVTFADILLLRDIGLLSAVDGVHFEMCLLGHEETSEVEIGTDRLKIFRPANSPFQSIKIVAFTELGSELLKLVDKKPVEDMYIEIFASHFRNEGTTIHKGKFSKLDDGSTHFKSEKDLTTTPE